MASEINVKQILQEYRNAYPELRTLTDEEILSVLNNASAGVNLSADERISMFGLNEQGYSGLGLEKQKQTQTMPDTNTLEAALRERINKVSEDTQAAEKNNSWIGKAWSWTKNTFGFGDSSNKVRDKQKEELQALNSGNIKEAFKSITGLDYTPENVSKFLNNEIKTTSEQALDGYKEGQDMASDIAGDIVSGIAAVGFCTIGIATGGIGLGLGLAIVGGGLLKSGVKALDTAGTDKKYNSFGHDLITGAFSGLLAPITGGLGGAVGKTIATKAGLQVLKHTGEKAVESGVKAMLTNPAGYQYVGGTLLKRGLAIGTEMTIDGATGGAIDTAFRTGVEQVENGEELNFEEIGDSFIQGGIGGFLMAPIIGGGIRGAGKVGNNLGKKIHTKKLDAKAFREEAEQSLLKRMRDTNSPEEIELVGTIKNKITFKNKALVEMMLQDETITNEQILGIINSLTKTTPLHPVMQIPTAGMITNVHFKNNSLRIKYAKNLLQNQNITNDQIPAILENLYTKNSKLLDTMLASKDFDTQSISDILRNSYYYNQDGLRTFPKSREKLALKLIENPEFPDSYISDIIGKTYSFNFRLTEKICDTKDFPKDHIATLLDNIIYNRKGQGDYILENNRGYKMKLTEKLLNDSNCPKNLITDIIGAVDSKQAKLFEQLYQDKNILKSELASILHIQNGLKKGEKLSFAEKVLLLTNATTIESSTLKYLEKYNISSEKINNLINSISLEMGVKKTNIEVDDVNIKNLYQNFINNRGKIDKIITGFNPDKFSSGIPLKYTRKKFISDICNIQHR